METLTEVLKDESRRKQVVSDGVILIDEEVQSKRGPGGLMVKGGYKTVKAIKPGVIGEALDGLLDDFAPAVDPHFVRARESGDVRGWFTAHADEIAESLLAVTDEKAKNAKNRVMKRAYTSLRGQAKKHTAAAMPRLGSLVEKHVR